MDIFGHFEFCYNRRNSFRTERASCIQMQYNTQETLPLFDGAFPVPPFAFPLYHIPIATLYYQASMVPLCCAQTKLRSNLRLCSPRLISNFCCFLEELILSDKVKYKNMIKSWRNNASIQIILHLKIKINQESQVY